MMPSDRAAPADPGRVAAKQEDEWATYWCSVHGPLPLNNWCPECGEYQGEKLKLPRKVAEFSASAVERAEAAEAALAEAKETVKRLSEYVDEAAGPESVLLPVATLNGIGEQAERDRHARQRAERALAELPEKIRAEEKRKGDWYGGTVDAICSFVVAEFDRLSAEEEK